MEHTMMGLRRKEIFVILILIFGGLYWLTLCNMNEWTTIAATIYNKNDNNIENNKILNKTNAKTSYSHVNKLDFDWLANNPVYKKFKIKPSVVKKRVNLLVIVSSGPRRVDRRNAVRQTWWSTCKQTGEIVPECIFITDHTPIGSKNYNITKEESEKYGDMRFQNVPGGATFGLRMLNHMLYAVSHYEFDYFMRVDDDFFLCFQNILAELPLTPPLRRFHWGFVHLKQPNVIRPDECILIYSHDVIETFLGQDPDKMLCHPFAGQMIGVWSTVIDLNGVWHHDKRLWHNPPARDVLSFKTEKDLCHKYIGLHGAYPKDMLLFWSRRGEFKKREGNLKNYSLKVALKKQFDWRAFHDPWKYEPKLCKENYQWDMTRHGIKDGSYVGRQRLKR